MTLTSIAQQRLQQQHIAQADFEKPEDVVSWMGAIQAQDYLGALWAIGLRMKDATETDIEMHWRTEKSSVPGRCAARCTLLLLLMRAGC